MQSPPGSETGTKNIQGDKEICLRWHDRSAAEPEILATGNPDFVCIDVAAVSCSAFLQYLHQLPDLLITKAAQAPDNTEEAEAANTEAMVRDRDAFYVIMRSKDVSNSPVKPGDLAGSTSIYKSHAPSFSVLTGH